MSVMTKRPRKLGQRSTSPLALNRTARAPIVNWEIGLTTLRGCKQFGIASTGVKAPENDKRGGFTKKFVMKACRADLLKVAMTVPMLIPDITHKAAPLSTSARLP